MKILTGSIITADFGNDLLLERGNKRFGKFFLISSSSNLKNWRVPLNTIPQRIQTFKDRPFISEPGLAHFGADDLSIDQIIAKQEEFRVGTIREVVAGQDGTAFAVVEFANTPEADKVWKEMKNGKAIYTSPAVGGYAHMEGNEKVFHDWFGLHLARVGDPAYGVFHASLKQTCEGPEGACIKTLVASASAILNSSHLANADNNESRIMSNNTGTAETDEEMLKKKKKLEDEVAGLEKRVAALTDSVSKTESMMGERTPGSEGQTTPVTDAISQGETQSGKSGDEVKMPRGNSASAFANSPEFKKMQAQLAAYEARDKAEVIDKIVDMKATAGMINDETETAERESLGKLSVEQLNATASMLEGPVGKIVELASRLGEGFDKNDGQRIVRMPQTGTASAKRGDLPRRLEDCRTEWWT